MNNFNLDSLLETVIDRVDGSSLVDRAKAAASELLTEEYKPPPTPVAPSADLSQLEDVTAFWRLFDLQVWTCMCPLLRALPEHSVRNPCVTCTGEEEGACQPQGYTARSWR